MSGRRIGEALPLTERDITTQFECSPVRMFKSLDDLYELASVGKPKSRYARHIVEILKNFPLQANEDISKLWNYK